MVHIRKPRKSFENFVSHSIIEQKMKKNKKVKIPSGGDKKFLNRLDSISIPFNDDDKAKSLIKHRVLNFLNSLVQFPKNLLFQTYVVLQEQVRYF